MLVDTGKKLLGNEQLAFDDEILLHKIFLDICIIVINLR